MTRPRVVRISVVKESVGDRAPMRGEKCAPGGGALRYWPDAFSAQEGRDRRSGDAMPEIRQGPLSTLAILD